MQFPSLLSILSITILISVTISLTPQNGQNVYQPQQQPFLIHEIFADNDTASSLIPDREIQKSAQKFKLPAKRQVVGGDGYEGATLTPSQYPTVTVAGSLFTVGSSTSAVWKEFTQTFAETALGTWSLGQTPRAGTIGLGKIHGTVEVVGDGHARAVQTPSPRV